MKTAHDVLDFLYGDSEYMGIQRYSPDGMFRGSGFAYSKEEILDFMEKGLDFEDMRRISGAQDHLQMMICCDRKGYETELLRYKIFCMENGINFESYVDMEELKIPEKTIREKAKDRRGSVYVVRIGQYCKIGKSIELTSRIRKYQTENPEEIELIHHFETERYGEKELELHEKFKKKRHRGEWFKLNEEDIRFIKTL